MAHFSGRTPSLALPPGSARPLSEEAPVSRRRFLLRMAGFAAATATASLWPWNVVFADKKWIKDKKKIAEWVQLRQALEVQLAWDLLETFNKDKGLITGLRLMAEKALEDIFSLSTLGKKAVKAVEKAIAEEARAMTILKKRVIVPAKGSPYKTDKVKKFKNLERIVKVLPDLDAQGASDIIRLYGTVVEEVSAADKKGFKKYADLEKLKDSYRKGVTEDEIAAIWNQDPNRKFGRHRFHKFKKKQYKSFKKSLAKTGVGAVRGFLTSQGGGQSLFGLADHSTLGRIDRVFGLVEAADISGTTTDTLFFMNQFMSDRFDPVYRLLPLATIVAGAHHSLLEVALALTLNGVCDYHVGYYTTLRTKEAGRFLGNGWKEIKAALEAAETHKNNRHMLIAHKGKKKKKTIAGCFKFSKKDKKFRKFCEGKNLLTAFKKAKAFPSKKEIETLFGKQVF